MPREKLVHQTVEIRRQVLNDDVREVFAFLRRLEERFEGHQPTG